MYKKLILVTASASFTLAAQAAEQANPAFLQATPPVSIGNQADSASVLAKADAQANNKPDTAKAKVATPPKMSEQPVTELEAVIVTSPLPTKLSQTTVPVTVLSDEELTMKMGHTIGETLKQELGITSQSFGPGVGTPVIRGQSGPRVRVLQNGIGSNDVSQLSPDHATSVEPSMAERIEVLRGPATLLYGSGAMGGVVNVIDNRVPTHLSSKPFNADFEQRYDSAFDETSTALKTEGSEGHFAYHLDGLYRNRGDMSIGGTAINAAAAQALDPTLKVVNNSHGYIPNTSAETINGSAGASYIGDSGFVGIAFNQLHNNYGIAPDGGFDNGFASPNVRIDLRQKKYDFKSELNNPFRFADKISMRLGYTDYAHTELDGGVPGIPFSPGTAFTNKTYEGRVELTHKAIGPFKGAIGFQAISSQLSAFDFPTGGVPTIDLPLPPSQNIVTNIVPSTQTNSFGVFGLESFESGPVNYQLGLRMEDSSLNPSLSNSYTAPFGTTVASSYNYTPISASASALWKLDKINSLNMAITRSQRAPQVQELFSNGYHDATRSYELGDPNLQMETSYNLDIGYKFKTDWMKAELDLFNNWTNNYIYQRRTGDFVQPGFIPTLGSQPLTNAQCQALSPTAACTPVTASMQGGAIFRGYEGKLVFPVLEKGTGLLELTLFSDYTNGQLASGGAVPRMPPLRFGFQWDYTQPQWSGNLRFTHALAQDNPGANDTTTPSYNLLTAGGQYQLKSYHDTKIMLFVKGNNLLNENIRNSVSYLRNFAPEPGRGAELGIRISY